MTLWKCEGKSGCYKPCELNDFVEGMPICDYIKESYCKFTGEPVSWIPIAKERDPIDHLIDALETQYGCCSDSGSKDRIQTLIRECRDLKTPEGRLSNIQYVEQFKQYRVKIR
jgi:hypothetical protein